MSSRMFRHRTTQSRAISVLRGTLSPWPQSLVLSPQPMITFFSLNVFVNVYMCLFSVRIINLNLFCENWFKLENLALE